MNLTPKQKRAIRFAKDAKRTGGQINGKTSEEWRRLAYPETPELNKLKAIAEKSQAIGEFVALFREEKGFSIGQPHQHTNCRGWMEKNGQFYRLRGVTNDCGLQTDQFVECGIPLRKLLAEFFDIDESRCEDERRAILDFLQIKI